MKILMRKKIHPNKMIYNSVLNDYDKYLVLVQYT